MKTPPSFPWSPLLREQVEQQQRLPLDALELALLRLLVWLPLLSAGELSRMCEVCGITFDEQTVRSHLLALTQRELLGTLPFAEPGYTRHHRYYVTDLGLYLLATSYEQTPLAVPVLASCYPVTRHDLVARLARPQVHLALMQLVSRLAEPGAGAYRLIGYRQPYRLRYPRTTPRGTVRRWSADAALLLGTPAGDAYVCLALVDHLEVPQSQQHLLKQLQALLEVEAALALAGEDFPPLLVLTHTHRFALWRECLEQVTLLAGRSVLPLALTDLSLLASRREQGIWLTGTGLASFSLGAEGAGVIDLHGLGALLKHPASADFTEHLQQQLTLDRLRSLHAAHPPKRNRQVLRRYVGDSLEEEARRLLLPTGGQRERAEVAPLVREGLLGERAERLHVTAALNLVLTPGQKQLLTFLLRHPYLALEDLLALLAPASEDLRLVRSRLDPLVTDFALVSQRIWREGDTWRERERYQLSEAGLRYLAQRGGLLPEAYLSLAPDWRQVKSRPPVFEQAGAWGLWRQRDHTFALYHCLRLLLLAGEKSGAYTIVHWQNAHEAVRSCFDPLAQSWFQVRPDAELLYLPSQESGLVRVLIEFDRGTTSLRDYERKFAAYAAYEQHAREVLPPVLMILLDPQSASAINQALSRVGTRLAFLVLVSLADLLRDGLLPTLFPPNHLR